MPAAAKLPAWVPKKMQSVAVSSTANSQVSRQQTGSEPPRMSPKELKAMLESNMGRPLIFVTDLSDKRSP